MLAGNHEHAANNHDDDPIFYALARSGRLLTVNLAKWSESSLCSVGFAIAFWLTIFSSFWLGILHSRSNAIRQNGGFLKGAIKDTMKTISECSEVQDLTSRRHQANFILLLVVNKEKHHRKNSLQLNSRILGWRSCT